jgi:hypothetical protein
LGRAQEEEGAREWACRPTRKGPRERWEGLEIFFFFIIFLNSFEVQIKTFSNQTSFKIPLAKFVNKKVEIKFGKEILNLF